MRKGDKRVKVVDSKSIELSYLGKGQFTEAWQDDSGRVYIWTTDGLKESLSCWPVDNVHVPQIKFEDYQEITFKGVPDEAVNVLSMPYYKGLMAADKIAWAHYKKLAALWDEVFKPYNPRSPHSCWDVTADFANKVQESDLPDSLKEAIWALRDSSSNYGDTWYFEFSKRNLGVDSEGNLILLDVMFDVEKVHMAYEAAMAAARRRKAWRY